MNLEIRVEEAGTVIASYAVTEGKQQIGSDPSCALRVTHPEVSSVAAVLEVSAGAVFIRNQNDFPIFVGSHQLASGSVAEWRPGSVVQLTRSIALALEPLGSASALDAGLGTEKKNSINSFVQIAVIIFSVGFSAIMLSSDGESTTEEDSSVISFDDLIQQYEQSGGRKLANLNHEQKVLLRYLTEALRHGNSLGNCPAGCRANRLRTCVDHPPEPKRYSGQQFREANQRVRCQPY